MGLGLPEIPVLPHASGVATSSTESTFRPHDASLSPESPSPLNVGEGVTIAGFLLEPTLDPTPSKPRLLTKRCKVQKIGTSGIGDKAERAPIAEPRTLRSVVSEEEITLALIQNLVPLESNPRLPCDLERAYYPPVGAFAVYLDQIESGLSFPLPRVIEEFLCLHHLCPAQVVPNAWKLLIAFCVRCLSLGRPATLGFLRWGFQVLEAQGKRGWYYLKANPGNAVFWKLPSSNKGWHKRYFFLDRIKIWNFPIVWGTPSNGLVIPSLSTDELDFLKLVKGTGKLEVDDYLLPRSINQHNLYKHLWVSPDGRAPGRPDMDGWAKSFADKMKKNRSTTSAANASAAPGTLAAGTLLGGAIPEIEDSAGVTRVASLEKDSLDRDGVTFSKAPKRHKHHQESSKDVHVTTAICAASITPKPINADLFAKTSEQMYNHIIQLTELASTFKFGHLQVEGSMASEQIRALENQLMQERREKLTFVAAVDAAKCELEMKSVIVTELENKVQDLVQQLKKSEHIEKKLKDAEEKAASLQATLDDANAVIGRVGCNGQLAVEQFKGSSEFEKLLKERAEGFFGLGFDRACVLMGRRDPTFKKDDLYEVDSPRSD